MFIHIYTCKCIFVDVYFKLLNVWLLNDDYDDEDILKIN